METEHTDKLVLLGAGNLAWHLGPALQDAGFTILQVCSRTENSARLLGERLGVEWITDPAGIDEEAGILVFCISDNAIPDLMCRIELRTRPVLIHTAGSVSLDVFNGIAREYGVLYPLMTFTKDRTLDLQKVPFCIEGNSEYSLALVERMARGISEKIYQINSEERKILHLGGIIASNFSNHMYHLAADFLSARGMDFEILKPLIMETTSKIMEMEPATAQTGPASRNDTDVIQDHADLLKDLPELQKIYTFVTDSITNHFKS
jgi:predicted short-subunit dehydrogenase-like oxidoreductase (DUF2520 family)